MKIKIGTILKYTVIIAIAAVFLFPFYWMLRTSVMSLDDIFKIPIVYFPKKVELQHYAAAFEVFPLLKYLLNSLFITSLATMGAMLSSSLCAFGFSRINWRGRDTVFTVVLSGMLLPSAVTLIPTFLMWRSAGVSDSYASARLDLENESTNLRLDIDTNYPYSGKIKLKITAKSPKRFKIALRIPLWCKQYTLLIKGEKIDNTVNPDGYIILERVWDSSDEIELLLDLNTRYMKANNNVWDLNGKAALLRGPLVYCVEKVDNPVMSGLCYNLDYKFEPVRGEGVLEDEILLAGKCNVDRNSGSLYEECTRQRETVSTTAIPYFAWGNRGKTDMDVFLPIV